MISEEQVVDWFYEAASDLLEGPVGMGAMEKIIDRVSLECRRQVLERLVQEAAEREELCCPRCRKPLSVEEHHRARRVTSTFGLIRFTRSYGSCKACEEYFYPADVTLGLQGRAPASPRVQEICALTALRAPAGQAQEDVRRMSGIDLDPSSLHREARRQGERALALRDADVELSKTLDGVLELAARAITPSTPFTLVIEIDAWNIRERDNWGLTEELRAAGEDTGRWHWVYTATTFRLDQRGTTATGRPVIAERGYVATRRGLDAFRAQLYTETIQRGLLQAEEVLILADGAVWIWNIAEDRFKGATQRVDMYHVREHLWDLAHELFGRGSEKAKQWVSPYLNWLKRRKNGAADLIEGLEGLRSRLEHFSVEQQEAIEREIGYFAEHKDRMDYKNAKALGQPVGSGAIESTCSQYQRRFKLPGQFWSLAGDEAFLALATLHRNDRWKQLFPHDAP
jgi:hypothetical protein